jgi:hypothetical protein
MNVLGFSDTAKLQEAYLDIKRYQDAYFKLYNRRILVRWKQGWYAIGKGEATVTFRRPTQFRDMIGNLEKWGKAKHG